MFSFICYSKALMHSYALGSLACHTMDDLYLISTICSPIPSIIIMYRGIIMVGIWEIPSCRHINVESHILVVCIRDTRVGVFMLRS